MPNRIMLHISGLGASQWPHGWPCTEVNCHTLNNRILRLLDCEIFYPSSLAPFGSYVNAKVNVIPNLDRMLRVSPQTKQKRMVCRVFICRVSPLMKPYKDREGMKSGYSCFAARIYEDNKKKWIFKQKPLPFGIKVSCQSFFSSSEPLPLKEGIGKLFLAALNDENGCFSQF